MGLFEKFIKRSNNISIKSPLDGMIRPIGEVDDPLFSKKMMGDGFFIEPTNGDLYAPCNATVEMIFPSKHAIGLKLKDDTEILIHFGLDTVELNGKGFEVFVEKGQKVSPNTLLLKANLDFIRKHAKSDCVIVIFTKLNENVNLKFNYGGDKKGCEVVEFC